MNSSSCETAGTAPKVGLDHYNLPPGTHPLTARLIDSYGQTTVSAPRAVTVIADGDGDGDGWTDPQELAAGTDSQNQDTDGDGIPDSIDSDPLVSALAFADADGRRHPGWGRRCS